MKLVGLTAEQIPALHNVLKDNTVVSKNPVRSQIVPGGGDYMNWHDIQKPHARLLSVKYDEKHETYTAEVEVQILRRRNNDETDALHANTFIRVERSVVEAIYDALDIYPPYEEVITIDPERRLR